MAQKKKKTIIKIFQKNRSGKRIKVYFSHLQVGFIENNCSVDGNSTTMNVLRFRSRCRTSSALQYHSAGHAVGSRSRLFGECGWTRAFILFWYFTLPGDRRALQRTNLQFIIIKIILYYIYLDGHGNIPSVGDDATR